MPTAARRTDTKANSPMTCVRNRGYANAESKRSFMVSIRTGTVGFASCRIVRRVAASDPSSSTEVRARIESELPQSWVEGTKITGGAL
jgi:hypothetical protein